MRQFLLIAFVSVFSCMIASAQPEKTIKKDFERFSTINVQDKFVVKFKHSEKYSVHITSDERIAAHVQAYEKNGTLFLILDEKEYTKELKKELKKKGAAEPKLEATVYMPTIKSLVFSDKATLAQCDMFDTDDFTLTATNNAEIHHLKINCRTAEIEMSKNAELNAEFRVIGKLNLTASNSSNIELKQKGGVSTIEMNNSAKLEMRGDIQEMKITSASSSESHIAGKADDLTVKASGSSRTDTELLEVSKAMITQEGSSKCHVNVLDKMFVNLTDGSMLTFKNKPDIIIDRIVNSTLIRHDDPKRK